MDMSPSHLVAEHPTLLKSTAPRQSRWRLELQGLEVKRPALPVGGSDLIDVPRSFQWGSTLSELR